MELLKNFYHQTNPVEWAKDNFDFIADEWQEKVLMSEDSHIILNCARQTGKSTVSGILALHQAIFYPNSLILIVSPSQRQSSEVFKKVTSLIKSLPDRGPKRIEDNKLSIMWESGSRIVSLPATEGTIRGYSAPQLIIIDEASRVPDSTYLAVRPMIAVSGGRLVILSTPAGKRGFFFDEWRGDNEWLKIEHTAYDSQRMTADFLAKEKQDLGEYFFNQEYACIFQENVQSFFTLEEIEDAFTDKVEEWVFE